MSRQVGRILEQVTEAEGGEVDEHDLEARIEKPDIENGIHPGELHPRLMRGGRLNRSRSWLRGDRALECLLSSAAT